MFRPHVPWSDAFHAMLSCTLASSFIGELFRIQIQFFFSPARGHENGAATRRRLRGKFLSCSIRFARGKESAAVLAVARTRGGFRGNAWWETFIMTASEWFYYWRGINSVPGS